MVPTCVAVAADAKDNNSDSVMTRLESILGTDSDERRERTKETPLLLLVLLDMVMIVMRRRRMLSISAEAPRKRTVDFFVACCLLWRFRLSWFVLLHEKMHIETMPRSGLDHYYCNKHWADCSILHPESSPSPQ